MREIDLIYFTACAVLLEAPKVGNTRERIGMKIELEDITENIISIRDISPSYLFGEWLWYFTGRQDTRFISQFGSMWSKLSDDGFSAHSAYGYLIKYAFGFDQMEKVIEILQRDPNSRRAVININTPRKEVFETKDEPCTIALQFLLRDNKLNCICTMRSNDIYYGFPYDIAFFTEVQKRIADELGVGYGPYIHNVGSLHLYDHNYEAVKNIVENPVSKLITFDREAFKQYEYELADSIEERILSPYGSREYVRSSLLYDMIKYCGYKEEKVNEN